MANTDSSSAAQSPQPRFIDGVEYRPIPTYPGYWAGSNGAVISTRTGGWYQLKESSTGEHVIVTLKLAGKWVLRSPGRLILLAFVGECPPGITYCEHLDGNPRNNAIDNLRWGKRRRLLHSYMKRGEDLTQAKLNEILDYNPETGVFTWKVQPKSDVRVGSVAGSVGHWGYRAICINWRMYKAHRLAFLWVHGRWPNGDIDHIDRNRDNNAIANLRECTRGENLQNRAARYVRKGQSRLIGACRNGKWFKAIIRADGVEHYLGQFRTEEEAHAAYLEAKRRLHTHGTI